MAKVLITGAAGFIGYHLSARLLERGDEVVGVDNLNDYYAVELKRARLAQLTGGRFSFVEQDLSDHGRTVDFVREVQPDSIVHLAAQAGVRYSLTNPRVYAQSNLDAFLAILEAARAVQPRHLVFASSSSVYGANAKVPYSVDDNVDHPVSLYAATKKANELLAHSYSHLYKIPATGLRFFTVYGPWGRPDMAYYTFTRDIFEGRTIKLFNYGKMRRDFTFVDDVVEAVARVIDRPAAPDAQWDAASPKPGSSYAPYRIYNVGNRSPVELGAFVAHLERIIGKRAVIEQYPMQPGDVLETYADTSQLERDIGFTPRTDIAVGLERFVKWYRGYHRP